MSFIGREYELLRLEDFLYKRKIAGLAVVSGRRRVGKSTLIEYASSEAKFYEFYGLGPREDIGNSDQLLHFGDQLGSFFGIPAQRFASWFDAFSMLAALTKEGPAVILLDEISWMAKHDKDFPGVLKGFWDTQFKKNPNLRLILCGSVTSWIEDNILNDKGYVGRISLIIKLEEMPLYDVDQFWKNYPTISTYEKFKILCVTGGIPRYLEEINPKETAEENIKRICFSPDGFLLSEFDKIFKDIFEKKATEFKAIIYLLADGDLEGVEICNKLKISYTGGFSNKLKKLEAAGFIARDYVFDSSGKKTGASRYRLRDNYIRFYLKYVEPKKILIEKGVYQDLALENVPGWYSIMGLQFQNLVHNNLLTILKLLKIPHESIVSAAPYFQNATKRKKACQIDLLIQTKHTVYIVEIKFRKVVDKSVIEEVSQKIRRLKYKQHYSIRPVLIYLGELSESIAKSEFFSNIIHFEDLLEK